MSYSMVSYNTISEKGSLIEKEGYHQMQNCNCKPTTKKGAYRDEIYQYEGNRYYFYHQNLVVKNTDDKFVIDSCGFRSKTTKERINRYIPKRYYVKQKDFNWYLVDRKNNTEKEFTDKMELEK